MSEELRRIIPLPPVAGDEIFAAYQATSEFYQEVRYREEFERYCQWYYTTAQRHRQELQKMKREVNILGWFRWGRR
ncbi:hypothetical protein [Aerosakkonema funiforme]|uniref:Uncharacterized protein n=1 Tax=Aerosakkonema funiforme FACHB-1375 TaxID=2949571 RepID=A0A926VGK2_9CYAN|nr:hypothetical protein [Aerosakkonema funiforme]MBD2183466.1 hypothetical protein [Aerosakkonema funiforme FACHB-1375]